MATASTGSMGNPTLKEKPMAVRQANIMAARAVADAIRTSLGPRGMDKMIQNGKGKTLITNDGHTILKEMAVMHPAAKMLVDLSAAQDVEAGDGTTSVVVICGSLLGSAEKLLGKGNNATAFVCTGNQEVNDSQVSILLSSPRAFNELRRSLLRF
jgi:T-complex protein 1 subunit delta